MVSILKLLGTTLPRRKDPDVEKDPLPSDTSRLTPAVRPLASILNLFPSNLEFSFRTPMGTAAIAMEYLIYTLAFSAAVESVAVIKQRLQAAIKAAFKLCPGLIFTDNKELIPPVSNINLKSHFIRHNTMMMLHTLTPKMWRFDKSVTLYNGNKHLGSKILHVDRVIMPLVT